MLNEWPSVNRISGAMGEVAADASASYTENTDVCISSFAAPQNEAATARKEELYAKLCAAAAELRELGATEEEILARLKGEKTK